MNGAGKRWTSPLWTDAVSATAELLVLRSLSYMPISFYQETVDIALICIPAVGYSLNFVAMVLVLHLHRPDFRFLGFLLENRK